MRTWTLPAPLAFAVLLAHCAEVPRPQAPSAVGSPGRRTPVQAHGRLRVCGTRICDQGGQPVQLRGMSLFWSNTGWGGERFYDASVVATLANGWHASLIRAAMGIEGRGPGSNAANESRARAVVDAAIARGLYVIVDWHSHAPLQDEAVAFFSKMARAYANVPNVIWEPFNEPLRISWSDELKPYHEAVIAAIRKAGSRNLVVAGTPTWSQDVDSAALDPITTDADVAYALHFYAGTHKQSLRDKAAFAMERGVALFVTEWGTCDASGDRNFDPVESRLWTDWMDANGISSANWALNDKAETASALVSGASTAGPWLDSELTESGRWVKEYLAAGKP
jgi:endoglucanase